MTSKLRAILEQKINEFFDESAGTPDWPDGWCYNELAVDMAKSAELVFDSCMKGQAFAEKESMGR